MTRNPIAQDSRYRPKNITNTDLRNVAGGNTLDGYNEGALYPLPEIEVTEDVTEEVTVTVTEDVTMSELHRRVTFLCNENAVTAADGSVIRVSANLAKMLGEGDLK